jgi:hypothetical protein
MGAMFGFEPPINKHKYFFLLPCPEETQNGM